MKPFDRGGREPDGGVPALSIRDLTVVYRQEAVLDRATADVPLGSLTAIVGPNGAGKSTLIKAALGLAPVSGGSVRIFGRQLAEARSRVAYVPQRTSVDWDFPTDVLDVVTMGRYRALGWLRRPGRAERKMAMDALAKVGMTDLAHRQIGELSGGQQQRVFLARALVQDADLYLMDEPFTGVDAATEQAIAGVMADLGRQGRTVVAVHHDLSTIEGYFDRVILLNRGVIASGPVSTAFTLENVQRTYGGRLAVFGNGAALPVAAD